MPANCAYADPLSQDDYTLTLVSGTPGLGLSDGAVNALDGECPGGSCDSPAELPSGDGEGGGDYVATFSVDTLPHVIGVTPAPDSSGVSKAANVAITFDEPVDPLTVTTRTFLLKDEMGRPVPASVSVGTRDTDAVLDPTSPLDPDTTYTVVVTSRVTDITGRQAVAFTSRFRTGEETQARTLSEVSDEAEGLASWSITDPAGRDGFVFCP